MHAPCRYCGAPRPEHTEPGAWAYCQRQLQLLAEQADGPALSPVGGPGAGPSCTPPHR